MCINISVAVKFLQRHFPKLRSFLQVTVHLGWERELAVNLHAVCLTCTH